MRAVLEFLLRNSDSTVPTIARKRHVTRQHIQSLVNPLLEQERFRMQNKLLTDGVNEERTKLGLGPYQAPLAAMD